MARCPATRPSAAVTTLSTPSFRRLVLASTSLAACSSTWRLGAVKVESSRLGLQSCYWPLIFLVLYCALSLRLKYSRQALHVGVVLLVGRNSLAAVVIPVFSSKAQCVTLLSIFVPHGDTPPVQENGLYVQLSFNALQEHSLPEPQN